MIKLFEFRKEELILETVRKLIINGYLCVLMDRLKMLDRENTLKRNLNTWETNFLIRILIKLEEIVMRRKCNPAISSLEYETDTH